jgi:6-pyruvoyltetrahydropterin/6-carboxytetrahydropterin synthase
VTVFKVFTVAAAHWLPKVPADHKCARLHGHTFRIEVHVTGPVGPATGWVMDFADIAEAFQPLHRVLDHTCLNDIDGLTNPTSENLARWVWERLLPALPGLTRVVVQESPDSGCICEGEGDPGRV